MNNRRHFLSTLLGASAATALAQDAKLSYLGENIQFGLVTYQWGKDWDIPTIIQNCSAAKVTGVELRVEHKHNVTPDLTPAQRAEVRRQFEDAPVKLLGMGTNFEFHSANADEVRKNIDGAKAFIKLSHDIGGTGVKVKPNALPKDVPTEKTLVQIGKALAELGDHAIGFGQEIRLEVHGKDTSLLPNIKTIMDACADAENVRVCWNSNDTDLEGEGIEANFAMVKDRLAHVTHIRGVSLAPNYPFPKLAKLLVEADYEGHVCLEAAKLPAGDIVAALAEQRELFMNLITEARKAAA
ncbi:MAG: TIM barrel protein [Verrucomicrobiaceae bacterium]|nr:TIM barrel protein [Verrucomicrobiaceae bacterium]